MKRPTYKIVLRSKILKDGKSPVNLRVTFDRKSNYFFLGRYCTPDQWADGRFNKSYPNYKRENDILATYEQRASDAIFEMERNGQPFDVLKFQSKVFPNEHTGGSTRLLDLIYKIRDEQKAIGKPGNAEFYQAAASVVNGYKPKTRLSDIDTSWIKGLERWAMINRNLTPGGLKSILRNVRAACNRAIQDKIMSKEWYPFSDYSMAHLKNVQARKGAPLEFFRALDQVKPDKLTPIQELSLDLFLFSFYTRGMNLADIAELTEKNIQSGRLVYVRKKTGKEYNLKLNERATAILKKYRKKSGLIFPIYTNEKNEAEKHKRKRNFYKPVNRCLREIADMIRWDVPGLSFYTARHSYAEILKEAGIPVGVISQGLGHSSLNTTEHYLKRFGDRALDEADRVILN